MDAQLRMDTESYHAQEALLPSEGRVIVGAFDGDSILLFQAYRPGIAAWAVEHQRLGGPLFSFSRMSWVKTSFLWMMYRSNWATRPDQECVLSVRLRRSRFDWLVESAVSSQYDVNAYGSAEDWRRKIRESDVRVQWDPDRDPLGLPLKRRAIQLGLRGDVLRAFACQDILEIQDVTPFVREERRQLASRGLQCLRVPVQREYSPNMSVGD